ncbi:uncharacterized protein LOC129729459 [Wyeomyia smithii]|uniref:uncharacterized protein LOC129729459 n=1 Tax=Wyeomyia smithii TaxID=174621 RepID=UPI002467FC9F|nr:uncharacterized protein LOC129729459 [Wyeomyia smithii]
MKKSRVLEMLFLCVLISSTASALECIQCKGVENCNDPAQDNVVRCDHGYAHSTLHRLTDMYPTVEEEIEPSDEFICVFANFTLQNQPVERFKTKGCLFKNYRTCSLKPLESTGHLDCLSCNSDRCNSAADLVCSTLLIVAGWFATQLFQKD